MFILYVERPGALCRTNTNTGISLTGISLLIPYRAHYAEPNNVYVEGPRALCSAKTGISLPYRAHYTEPKRALA
jgi:hypothetical protein